MQSKQGKVECAIILTTYELIEDQMKHLYNTTTPKHSKQTNPHVGLPNNCLVQW